MRDSGYSADVLHWSVEVSGGTAIAEWSTEVHSLRGLYSTSIYGDMREFTSTASKVLHSSFFLSHITKVNPLSGFLRFEISSNSCQPVLLVPLGQASQAIGSPNLKNDTSNQRFENSTFSKAIPGHRERDCGVNPHLHPPTTQLNLNVTVANEFRRSTVSTPSRGSRNTARINRSYALYLASGCPRE